MEMLLFLSCSFDYDDDLSLNLIMLVSLNFHIPWNIYTIYVNNLKIIDYRKGKIYPFECRVPKNSKREKKAFLSDQCKEIEENNRMGKTRDLFKKIRDTKGTFQAKMGTIKGRNGMDLIEAVDTKKRWQEYIELYKKDLHDPDNLDGVITHLEIVILECEVKWALGSVTMNKASGGYEIPVELFQILKYDAVKVLH